MLKKLFSRARKSKPQIPLKGYDEGRTLTRFVDALSDDDVNALNRLLPWHCFTVDSKGRRFGDAAWEGKRCNSQIIPDPRIVLMNKEFDLSNKRVLEIGCFEGVHTIGLLHFAGKVMAIDSRIENVVKTIVRCAFFGYSPTVFKCDIEDALVDYSALSADVMHHVGVLYHLKSPVQHLRSLKSYIRDGIMLDTHYALEHEADMVHEVDGAEYRYKKYQESGYADPFSGMYDHAKWLRLEDIIQILKDSGFSNINVLETRQERNGPRVLLTARRNMEQ